MKNHLLLFVFVSSSLICNGQTKFNYPNVMSQSEEQIEIKRISILENSTKVDFVYTNTKKEAHYIILYKPGSEDAMYILVDGKKYNLINTYNIGNKNGITIASPNDPVEFSAFFERTPLYTSSLDIIEGNEGGWNFYGVELNVSSIDQSLYTENDLDAMLAKAIDDSIGAANEYFSMLYEVSIVTGWEPSQFEFSLTQEDMKQYYEECKKDSNIRLIRNGVDKYNTGDLTPNAYINQYALGNLKTFGKDFFSGKFSIISIKSNPYGGKWYKVVFLNKPIKVYSVWIMNNRVSGVWDAHWTEPEIKLLQNNLELLNPAYGF